MRYHNPKQLEHAMDDNDTDDSVDSDDIPCSQNYRPISYSDLDENMSQDDTNKEVNQERQYMKNT